MIWVYCKTTDKPKEVGQYICKSNFSRGDNHTESKVMKDEIEEDCWLIETNPQNETSAMVYKIGNELRTKQENVDLVTREPNILYIQVWRAHRIFVDEFFLSFFSPK